MRWLSGVSVLILAACGSGNGEQAGAAGAPGGGAGTGTGQAGTGQAGTAQAGTSGGAAGGPGGTSGAAGQVSAPDAKWANVTNNLVALAPQGGDVTFVSSEPGTRRVIAGVARVGLLVTEDGGASWAKLGTGAGSAPMMHGPSSIAYDPDHPGTFWESGIYGPGVFVTRDDGVTFQRLGELSHNDQVSVDWTDPERKVLLAGPHEATQKLFKSTNGGMTWEDIGAKLPAGSSFSTRPLIVDSKTYLVGSADGGGTWGIFRSADAGGTWTVASPDGPAGWPLRASDGAIYWALAADKGLAVSLDGGKTWRKSAGPIRPFSAGPCELPDGRVLALGSTHILATSDKGLTWKEVGAAFPFPGANCKTYGFTYSVATKTLFINHNDCSGNLTADAIWRSGFDYQKE